MDEDETGDGIERLKPGELLISFQGKRVVIPLLSTEVISILQRSGSFSRAKATVEKMALKAIKRVVPGATMEDLRAIISPRDRLPHTGDGDRKKAALPGIWPVPRRHRRWLTPARWTGPPRTMCWFPKQ